jgi:biotin operon repressor
MKNTDTHAALLAKIAAMEAEIESLKAAGPRVQKSHRKYEVLALLKSAPHSTADLALAMNTSKNNIGSLLTYLRKDGITIHRDHMHRHYLVSVPAVASGEEQVIADIG